MSDAPRLIRVLIEGLFDPDAPPIDVRLRLEQRVTILHGRNGSGKTRTLALLAALQGGRLAEVRQAPFQRLRIELSNGDSLEMVPELREAEGAGQEWHLRYMVRGKPQMSSSGLLDPSHDWVGAWPNWLPVEELKGYSHEELVGPWSHNALELLQRRMRVRAHRGLVTLCRSMPSVKFIRADRLRARTPTHVVEVDGVYEPHEVEHESREPELTVERLSEVIRQQVQAADEEYRLQSTRLDSALRNRLLHMPPGESLPTLHELRARNTTLTREQERLSRLGLMREEPSPIGADAFTDDNRRMLTLLLEDGEQKIKPFRRLADKAEQLLDTLNRKLAPKVIKLDVKTGYHVASASGHDLPLSALSSGEQHELVLLHELLFEAEPNTLVLIDEPELSLHPTWQQAFLPDLLKIAQLSELDFILATHSPYIIGDRTDLMVRLGAPFDEHP